MLPANATGCNCKGLCIDPKSCACALLNGSDFPYVSRNGGRLDETHAEMLCTIVKIFIVVVTIVCNIN